MILINYLFFIILTNPLQFLYEPKFGKPWHNVMFNARYVVNYNNIFSYSLYFYVSMVQDFLT